MVHGASLTCASGYGEPIQSLFKFKDGEKVVGAVSLDPRASGTISAANPETPPPVHALAVSSDGYSLRFSLQTFLEPSTRAGRKFARVGEGGEVVGVVQITGDETIIAATRQARAMLCKADEVNFLSGPGRGVILIKLQKDDDRLLGFIASTGDHDLMTRRNHARRGTDDQHHRWRHWPRRQGGNCFSAASSRAWCRFRRRCRRIRPGRRRRHPAADLH